MAIAWASSQLFADSDRKRFQIDMEISDYLIIVEIAVGMAFGAIGLFLFIMFRTRGLYHASWTDAPLGIEQLKDDFQWPKGKIRFAGRLPDFYRIMFIGLFITMGICFTSIWNIGH